MTPYIEKFIPIISLGCLVAGIASILAGRSSRLSRVIPLLALGVISWWIALFLGSELGYRAWQSMPDPPQQAFNDASAAGALFVGWIPATLYCMSIFGITRRLGRPGRDQLKQLK